MRRQRAAISCLLGLLLLAAGGTAVAADPECFSFGSATICIGNSIIEGPDPIPTFHWDPVCADPVSGSERPGPGACAAERPRVAFDDRGWPATVWAYDVGHGHDIAFDRWTGNGWQSQPGFITVSLENDLDPRLFIDAAGAIHVTWWTEGPTPRVSYAVLPTGSSRWSIPQTVSGSGRRPSVTVWNGETLVAYERDLADQRGREVVVAALRPDGTWETTSLGSTSRSEALDVEFHGEGSKLWLRWRHANDAIAFSEYVDGQWVAPFSAAAQRPENLTVRRTILDRLLRP